MLVVAYIGKGHDSVDNNKSLKQSNSSSEKKIKVGIYLEMGMKWNVTEWCDLELYRVNGYPIDESFVPPYCG